MRPAKEWVAEAVGCGAESGGCTMGNAGSVETICVETICVAHLREHPRVSLLAPSVAQVVAAAPVSCVRPPAYSTVMTNDASIVFGFGLTHGRTF